MEELRELNAETQKEIKRAIREVRAGKYRAHGQVKAEMAF